MLANEAVVSKLARLTWPITLAMIEIIKNMANRVIRNEPNFARRLFDSIE